MSEQTPKLEMESIQLQTIARAAYVKGFMDAMTGVDLEGEKTTKHKLENMVMAYQSARMALRSLETLPGVVDPWTDEEIDEAHRLLYGK